MRCCASRCHAARRSRAACVNVRVSKRVSAHTLCIMFHASRSPSMPPLDLRNLATLEHVFWFSIPNFRCPFHLACLLPLFAKCFVLNYLLPRLPALHCIPLTTRYVHDPLRLYDHPRFSVAVGFDSLKLRVRYGTLGQYTSIRVCGHE